MIGKGIPDDDLAGAGAILEVWAGDGGFWPHSATAADINVRRSTNLLIPSDDHRPDTLKPG
jgi:hypothetical protein